MLLTESVQFSRLIKIQPVHENVQKVSQFTSQTTEQEVIIFYFI